MSWSTFRHRFNNVNIYRLKHDKNQFDYIFRNYLKLMEVMADAYNSEVCLTNEDTMHFRALAAPNQKLKDFPQTGSCLHGEPDLERLMKRNDLNPDQLRWIWCLWHDFVGPQIKNVYSSLVKVENLAANNNGKKKKHYKTFVIII